MAKQLPDDSRRVKCERWGVGYMYDQPPPTPVPTVAASRDYANEIEFP